MSNELMPINEKELHQKACELSDQIILNISPSSGTMSKIPELGFDVMQKARKSSELIKCSVQEFYSSNQDSQIGNKLATLKHEISKSNPDWKYKLLTFIPGGQRLSNHLLNRTDSKEIIEEIKYSLESGKEILGRNNYVFYDDIKNLQIDCLNLENTIKLAELIDVETTQRLEDKDNISDDQVKIIKESILFPLKQHIMDLKQQLIITQQGILSLSAIIQINREIIRGINRSLNVTLSALQIALITNIGLNHGRKELQKISTINELTTDIIVENSMLLKNQGTQVYKNASNLLIDENSLKTAFSNIVATLDELSTYRQQALDKMDSIISGLKVMGDRTKSHIDSLNYSNKLMLTSDSQNYIEELNK